MNDHKKYLTETVPKLLNRLKADMEPSFGIMTAHHMVEHLIWVTKSSVKELGPAPKELSDKQLGFMRFIEKGARFKHRPSDKSRADLDPPRIPDIQTAISMVPESINRLYAKNSDHEFYNPLMGKLSFDEMELFHANHFRYHLEEQFGIGLEM